jgi:hypothetical protein
VGRDGWLFYRPDLKYATCPRFDRKVVLARVQEKDPLPAIRHFRDELARLGIGLLVVPVPVKPSIYPEKLVPGYDRRLGPPVNVHHREFLRRLGEAGVASLDLTGTMWEAKGRGELYLPLDTHWTPLGMKVFASALASELRRRHPWLDGRARDYGTREAARTRHGDVYYMLGVPQGLAGVGARTVAIEQVIDPGTGEPVPREPEGAEVVLLGDSFTNVYSTEEPNEDGMRWGTHAGLGERLMLELGRPVRVVAVNGGAPTATRRLVARPGGLRGARLVVWSFAARELLAPETEWAEVDLPREALAAPKAPGGRVELTGEVVIASEPPDPKATPYPDALTYTQYRVLEVHEGTYDRDAVIAVEWMMRGRKLSDAAGYRPGQVHRMRLMPFSARVKEDPSLQSVRALDRTEDFTLEPQWVLEHAGR